MMNEGLQGRVERLVGQEPVVFSAVALEVPDVDGCPFCKRIGVQPVLMANSIPCFSSGEGPVILLITPAFVCSLT